MIFPASASGDSFTRRSSAALWAPACVILILSVAAGAGAFALGQLETRWLVYALGGGLSLLIVLVAPCKDRLLCAIFVLALQGDVYFRLSYGRAGSIEGIAIAFVVVAGGAWLVYRLLAYGPAFLKAYRLSGVARKPLLAIAAITAVSAVVSNEQFIGFAQLVFELELLFVYWLIFNFVRSQADLRRILMYMFAIVIIQSLVMYLQNALGLTFSMTGEVSQRGEVPRPGGTVSTNPAGFASFITPAMMIGIAFFFSKTAAWRPRSAILAAALGAIAIGLTFTRAAWAGAVLGLIVVSTLLVRRRLARWNRICAVAVIVVTMGMVLMPTMMTRLSHDYGAHAQKAAWEERWGLMRIAFNMIVHNPISGVGPGAYNYTYKEYVPPGLHQWTAAVHNEFLLRAAETGLPGMVAFVGLILAGFRIGVRLLASTQDEMAIVGAGWIAALCSLVWQMSWVPWTGFTYNAMLWFFLGLMDAACRLDAHACTASGVESSGPSITAASTLKAFRRR